MPQGQRQGRFIALLTSTLLTSIEDFRGWFCEVSETFELAGDQARVLQLAAEAWDLAQSARAEIAEEGITIRSATGAAKAHPAVATLNSAWDRFLKAVAMLGLNADEMPVAIPGQRQHIRSVK